MVYLFPPLIPPLLYFTVVIYNLIYHLISSFIIRRFFSSSIQGSLFGFLDNIGKWCKLYKIHYTALRWLQVGLSLPQCQGTNRTGISPPTREWSLTTFQQTVSIRGRMSTASKIKYYFSLKRWCIFSDIFHSNTDQPRPINIMYCVKEHISRRW